MSSTCKEQEVSNLAMTSNPDASILKLNNRLLKGLWCISNRGLQTETFNPPGGAVAAEEVGCFSVLVAVNADKRLAAHVGYQLTHCGLACSCLTNEERWLCMLPAPAHQAV